MNTKFLSMRLKATILSIISLLFSISSSAQLLYKITGNDITHPSYIFGTHHAASIEFADSIGLLKIIPEIDTVIGEVDMTNNYIFASALQMKKYMTAPKDSSLNILLGDSLFNKTNIIFNQITGISLNSLNDFKPMVANSILELNIAMKYMPNNSLNKQIDSEIQNIAYSLNKKVIGLETIDQQANILYNSLSIKQQTQLLIEAINNIDSTMANMKDLCEAYQNQDLNKLHNLSITYDKNNDYFINQLLTERNEKWLKQIPLLLQESPSLIVVGALHLCGEKGLIDALRKLGYTITAIK